jgi:hypothetical protein
MQGGFEFGAAASDLPLRPELGELVVIQNTQECDGVRLSVDVAVTQCPEGRRT